MCAPLIFTWQNVSSCFSAVDDLNEQCMVCNISFSSRLAHLTFLLLIPISILSSSCAFSYNFCLFFGSSCSSNCAANPRQTFKTLTQAVTESEKVHEGLITHNSKQQHDTLQNILNYVDALQI